MYPIYLQDLFIISHMYCFMAIGSKKDASWALQRLGCPCVVDREDEMGRVSISAAMFYSTDIFHNKYHREIQCP